MKNKILISILLLPTLVLLLHAIIPHHHHFDEYFGNDLAGHCKDVHHEQSDGAHCHAFNSSDTIVKYNALVNIITTVTLFVPNNFNKGTIKPFSVSKHKLILFNKLHILSKSFFSQTLLRAPPLKAKISA